jgi:dTMP kinase
VAARGRFVTFEGGEGAGKSTQVRRLADALRAAGLPVRLTREPGGSPGAEEIRGLLVSGETGRWDALTEALLHSAARRDHLMRTVLPALDAGEWVLSDRFADSTMAYQGYGHGLGREAADTLYGLVAGPFRPDLTLILDVPVVIGLARAAGRAASGGAAPGGGAAGGAAEDRYERMGPAFHERLREGFLDIARREPERCALIDAARDADAVAADVLSAVRARLGRP